MSLSRAPCAAAWYTGNPPGHIRIQVIGTPPSRCRPALSKAALDRGKFTAYVSRSRLTSAASRFLLMALTADNARPRLDGNEAARLAGVPQLLDGGGGQVLLAHVGDRAAGG